MILLGLVRLSGMEVSTAKEIFSDLWVSRGRLLLITATSVLAPVMELAFITSLYAMISPEKQASIVEHITRLGLGELYNALGGNAQYLSILTIAAAGLLCGALAAKFIFGYLHASFLFESFIKQAQRVVSAYLYASPTQVLKLDRGRVASIATSEALRYGRVVFDVLAIMSNLVGAGFFIIAATVLAPVFIFLGLLVVLFTALIMRRGYARQKAIGVRRVTALASLTGSLWDLLNGYRTIKIEAGERRVLDGVWASVITKQRWRLDKSRNELLINLGSEGVIYFALLGIVFLSSSALKLEASVVLIFLVLMFRVQKYFTAIQQAWVEIQHSLPSLAEIAEIMRTCQAESTRALSAKDVDRRPATLRLSFDRVGFCYNGSDFILQDLSFDTALGDRILIQGPSGVGKSTLLYLACGLLKPTTGTVRVNNHPLTDELFYQIRGSLAYVAPNAYLIRGSIRDNLCLGGSYSEEQIHKAITQARLTDLVARLQGGIDGDIGDDGSTLSLGERQRIMLARIFLKQPLLVILDEATANLDVETEDRVLNDLMVNIPREAVVLMVTHRAPIGVAFTRVFDLADGRLCARSSVDAGILS
jgi:ABC-type multidrug transport system fused ATPase/permease subunit